MTHGLHLGMLLVSVQGDPEMRETILDTAYSVGLFGDWQRSPDRVEGSSTAPWRKFIA